MSDEPPDDGSSNCDARIPPIETREQLPESGREHFDAIAESRGDVRGPFGVLLHSPPLAGRVAHLGAYVRFEGELPDAAREVAILATAYEWDCAYEWAAHEPIAREAGVGENAIEAARGASLPSTIEESEATVVRFVRELLGDHEVSRATYQAAADRFGDRGVVELAATVGYYSMLACVLNALCVLPDRTVPF